MDLICHPLPKKLLVLIPANMTEANIVPQAHYLFNRFLDSSSPFKVAVLKGMGNAESLDGDITIIRAVAQMLRIA
jgi:hypothetical protein